MISSAILASVSRLVVTLASREGIVTVSVVVVIGLDVLSFVTVSDVN